MSAYDELEARFHRKAVLGEVAAVLHWDHATMMPPGGAGARAEQLATLGLLRHELLTDPAVADLLDAAEADGDTGLDEWRAANLVAMRREWRHATAVPSDLVEALAKACLASEMAWRQARQDADFSRHRPHLEKVLDLVRQTADAKAEVLGCSPYDALLDQFEPSIGKAEIDLVFDQLAVRLPPLLERVLEAQAKGPAPALPQGPFPFARQEQLSRRMMAALGFDFDHGRLDVSAHPFTGGIPDDVRLTTRYDDGDFLPALMGTLHETGHALYERGLPADWRRQPVGRARGMVLHESQSLLIERQVCAGQAFLEFAAPLIAEAFERSDPALAADNLGRLCRRVAPGAIRVDADEVTYPLHIILRYRLEQALIAGDLAPRDLPDAWNQGMADLLGITPVDDGQGCLQDIHWADGAFGYFPTYTLGAIAAAQFYRAATAGDPEIIAGIQCGDFEPLLAWLRRHVHGHGSRLDSNEVLASATGTGLSAEVFLDHLEERYLS